VSIWFFIGTLLVVYGVLILGAGIAEIGSPPANVVLSNLHAGVWWGALMLALGVLYVVKFRPGKGSA
jgi:hypothetical protein